MPTDYGLKTPPLFSIIAKPLTKLVLTIKRAKTAKPVKIKIVADKSDYIDATQRSVRTILMDSAQDKRYKVGYIHLWHFASRKITQVFYLVVSEEEAVRRLLKRKRKLPNGQSHDTPALIRARLASYKKEADQLLTHFKKRGILAEINGERSIKEIHQEIMAKIESL